MHGLCSMTFTWSVKGGVCGKGDISLDENVSEEWSEVSATSLGI